MNVCFYPFNVSAHFLCLFCHAKKTKKLYTVSIEFFTPFMIPMVGVEPTLPKEHDFESVIESNLPHKASITLIYIRSLTFNFN